MTISVNQVHRFVKPRLARNIYQKTSALITRNVSNSVALKIININVRNPAEFRNAFNTQLPPLRIKISVIFSKKKRRV